MQVALQDCGCVALPLELQEKLGVGAGAVFAVICSSGELRLSVVSGGDVSGVRAGAACPVKTDRTDPA